jgi:hypothetical protein
MAWRHASWQWAVSLNVTCLVAAAAVAACSSGGSQARRTVSLGQLAADQEGYSGDTVSTSGVVRKFSDSSGAYFVLEDTDQNRVELEPAEIASPFDGQTVRVSGHFDFSSESGRRIEISSIRPIIGAPPGTSTAS